MNIAELRQYRLIQQGIARSKKQTPQEVIENLGAMQGQDYHGSLWAIGLRTGQTQAEVIKSIESHEVIRTWPQRGTLHFVPPLDAHWMVGLSADRLIKGAARRRVSLELNEAQLLKSEAIIRAALANGTLLSRPKIIELLEDEGISTKAGRGYHIMWYLAQTGVIFISAMDEKQPTYGLTESAFPKSIELSHNESVALHARRYFVSHGPATVQDFVWWSGLTVKDARFGLIENADLLRSEIIGTTEYWLDKQANLKESLQRSAYLLPGFDEYFLGYKDRSAIVDPAFMQKVVPGNNGMFKPTIVIDGIVVGTWQRVIKKGRVIVTLAPFEKLSVADLALIATPTKQYGEFLELPVEIEVVE